MTRAPVVSGRDEDQCALLSRLQDGRAFHDLVKREFVSGGYGADFHAYEAFAPSAGRRGFIDLLLVDADEHHAALDRVGHVLDTPLASVCVIEIKATDWDTMRAKNVRPNVLRHARQLLRYFEHVFQQLESGILEHLSSAMIYRRAPSSFSRRRYIESVFEDDYCTPVIWWDEQTPHFRAISEAATITDRTALEAALLIRAAALTVAECKELTAHERRRLLRADDDRPSLHLSANVQSAITRLERAVAKARLASCGWVIDAQLSDAECLAEICDDCPLRPAVPSGFDTSDVSGSTAAARVGGPRPWHRCTKAFDPASFASQIADLVGSNPEMGHYSIALALSEHGYQGDERAVFFHLKRLQLGVPGKTSARGYRSVKTRMRLT